MSSPGAPHHPEIVLWALLLLALAGLLVVPIISGPDWLVATSASASDRLTPDHSSGDTRPPDQDPDGDPGDAAPDGGRVAARVTPTPAEPPAVRGPGQERFAPVDSPEARSATAADGAPTDLLARVGDLRIHQVSAAPVYVGFHEAATSRALPMRPFGRLLTNRNRTRHEPAGDTTAGRPYAVMHSRGRSAPPTSAVDVVMRDGDPVRAPVSGQVVGVRSILVEGRHPDLRIEIQPEDAPRLRVVVIHVDGVRVRPGDPVIAGETRIADTARRFSFVSQIDELTAPERWPHIHLEVQPEPPPEPLSDPPEPSDVGADG